MNIVSVEICLAETKGSEYQYTAHLIEDQGRYYYRAKGVSIEISETEYHAVQENPRLYYFSTALKLHNRILTEEAAGPPYTIQ